MKFQVNNVECQNCVNIIKTQLEEEFGQINIDLSSNPKILTINLTQDKEENFKKAIDELGFKILRRID